MSYHADEMDSETEGFEVLAPIEPLRGRNLVSAFTAALPHQLPGNDTGQDDEAEDIEFDEKTYTDDQGRARSESPMMESIFSMDTEPEDPPIDISEVLRRPGPVPRSSPIDIRPGPSHGGSGPSHGGSCPSYGSSGPSYGSSGPSYSGSGYGADNWSELDLRNWCTGHPPRVSFLLPESETPRGYPPRRSTISDRPELDDFIKALRIKVDGEDYLPLTTRTVNLLSSYWRGLKPLADKSIFKRIVINSAANRVHADHIIAAIECIGEYCKYLAIVGPVHTTDFGDVFNREIGNPSIVPDWHTVFTCFQNLKSIVFKMPYHYAVGQYDEMSHTFHTVLDNTEHLEHLTKVAVDLISGDTIHDDGPLPAV